MILDDDDHCIELENMNENNTIGITIYDVIVCMYNRVRIVNLFYTVFTLEQWYYYAT